MQLQSVSMQLLFESFNAHKTISNRLPSAGDGLLLMQLLTIKQPLTSLRDRLLLCMHHGRRNAASYCDRRR